MPYFTAVYGVRAIDVHYDGINVLTDLTDHAYCNSC